jgi:hypothetical protein
MIAAEPSDVPNLWVGFVRTKAMYDMRYKRTTVNSWSTVTAMLATAATASTASELWISGVPVSLICFRRGVGMTRQHHASGPTCIELRVDRKYHCINSSPSSYNHHTIQKSDLDRHIEVLSHS